MAGLCKLSRKIDLHLWTRSYISLFRRKKDKIIFGQNMTILPIVNVLTALVWCTVSAPGGLQYNQSVDPLPWAYPEFLSKYTKNKARKLQSYRYQALKKLLPEGLLLESFKILENLLIGLNLLGCSAGHFQNYEINSQVSWRNPFPSPSPYCF